MLPPQNRQRRVSFFAKLPALILLGDDDDDGEDKDSNTGSDTARRRDIIVFYLQQDQRYDYTLWKENKLRKELKAEGLRYNKSCTSQLESLITLIHNILLSIPDTCYIVD